MVAFGVLLVVGIASSVFVLGRSYHLLINLLLTTGVAQASLVTLTGLNAFQLADDCVAALVILVAVAVAMAGNQTRALVLLSLIAGWTGVGLLRSPDLGVGVAQARQVLFPLGLVFAGYILWDLVKWRSVLRWVVLLATGSAIWTVVEQLHGRPVLDPVYYYLRSGGTSYVSLRNGLPPSYTADGIGGVTFRAGGPFMNAPSTGFFLAAGAIAALLLGVRIVLPIVGFALLAAYARAGMVIFVSATIVSFAWQKVGRWAAILAGVGLAVWAGRQFMDQGNTASHTDGFVSGTLSGVRSLVGEGLGSTGYQAALASGQVNNGVGTESLFGLYAAWLGVPFIALLAWSLIRLGRVLLAANVPSPQVWAALGMLAAAAVSETASSISATPALWLLVGVTLAGVPLMRPRGANPADDAPRMRRWRTRGVGAGCRPGALQAQVN